MGMASEFKEFIAKGNVMDPLELIDAYGSDALRFTIAALTGPGRDVKLGRKRVEDQPLYKRFWAATAEERRAKLP